MIRNPLFRYSYQALLDMHNDYEYDPATVESWYYETDEFVDDAEAAFRDELITYLTAPHLLSEQMKHVMEAFMAWYKPNRYWVAEQEYHKMQVAEIWEAQHDR
jgi:hypothetical protein